MKPREYQKQILNISLEHIKKGQNVIIELDCGLGKRFLQYSFITREFSTKKILLILQASASLFETYNYLQKNISHEEIGIIHSQISSQFRSEVLQNSRVVLTLPQTLYNTLKQYPDAIKSYEIVLINEVDQIVRKMSTTASIKHPYPKLMQFLENMLIIGMSGTLRDDHYLLDHEQMRIKKELETLYHIFPNTHLITMDSLKGTDIGNHTVKSYIIPNAVNDSRIGLITVELELYVEEAKEKLLNELKREDPQLYFDVKKDPKLLWGPLPVEPDIIRKFHQGYMVRKFLWAMPGENAKIHLIRYGLDANYVNKSLPLLPKKFIAIRELAKKTNKMVVLCSYLATVNTIANMLKASNINSVIISGEVSHKKRADNLHKFKNCNEPIVAILSNVGERDLDIPEADTLVLFDTIRTTKTVYQKLKRTRGGIVRILFYKDTKEKAKVLSTINDIRKKYSWSTEIMPEEELNI